jgi:hypothetical protein
MDAAEFSMPVIGLQCTLLGIFIVIALPHTSWAFLAFPLVAIGSLFTVGWAVAPTNTDTR